MSLTFYEASHRYRLDGHWVTGVTTLIKGGLPNDALKYWSAKYVAEWVTDHRIEVEALYGMGRGSMINALKETPWDKRDQAATKGTEVHNLAEQLVAGHEIEVPEHLHGYVMSCVGFLDDWQPVTLLKERPVAHRAHWWAGKFDYLCKLPNGETWMIDWKTTASGIWPETAFQLAAYSHAEFYIDDDGQEQPLPHVDRCAAVWLRTDGYSVIPVKADNTTYNEFRHIAFVSAAAKRAKGNRTEPGYVLPEITAREVLPE